MWPGNYVIHHRHFEHLRKTIRNLCTAKGMITLSDAREAVNAGRLFVVSILEFYRCEGDDGSLWRGTGSEGGCRVWAGFATG